MFVREKTARGHTYLYLVESVREGGRVRQRTICALGRKDALLANGELDRLIASMARHSERAMILSERPKLKGSAKRMRHYRERKRQGVVCVAPVPVYENDIDALVVHGRLKPEDKADTGKVAEAVEYLVDAWVRGELAPGGDA